MSTETKPASLAEALASLQTKLPRIEKANTADVVTQKGKYSYTYADLAQISRQLMPILGDLGLSFIAKPTVTADGRFVLAYKLLHTSKETEEGEYPLPTGGTPQSMGSAITYARRYCLCAVTGVAPEDDDDGAAAEAEARRPLAQPEPQWERPLPERATDWDWANGFETRVNAAGTQSELKGLFAELNSQYQQRALTDADRATLVQLVTVRKRELEGTPE